jgi:hypothetical protein
VVTAKLLNSVGASILTALYTLESARFYRSISLDRQLPKYAEAYNYRANSRASTPIYSQLPQADRLA